MRVLLTIACLLFTLAACPNGSGDSGEDAGPGTQEGIYETYLNDQLLGIYEATFIKGRCLGRLSIDAQTPAAQGALLAFADAVAAAVPLDGSAPADDAALVALIPTPPLSGALSDWSEDPGDQIQGPWLVSTNAFDWINGSGVPFDDNGFEAVAGEVYLHGIEAWSLDLELVNMATTSGAEVAFDAAGWNSGSRQ